MDRAKLKRVFDEVRNLPAEGRARRLSSLCGGEAELIGAVEELASSLDEASGFLEERPVEGGEGPGSRVGRYRLLQVIGEGGFGTVYMAEQREPVFRRVALKIVKLGMDTRQVVARFEQERQALALMDHPCIARVLDAGATEAGRPYFVMDLVRGEPITAYCRANRLAVPERLALFEQVCGAVQHAHQKGVIHRDLKPSNILVTMVDGRPVPKVIDFGIAKAIDQRLTEKTLFTEHRALIGTPEYMSPEQADRGGVDVDTRTDIYSLGVILYELLTGLTPLDGKRLRSAAYGELQRIIREEEPPKPSTRLSAERPAQAATGERPVGPDNVAATLVRGDLDWIVMMCLEKERGRRYESASGLGADVRRHLAGEPVAAAPPSALYAARKFVRRHRWPVAAGSAVLVTLLLGLAGTAYGLVEASRQRDAANEAAEVATREAAAATAAQQAADTQRAVASAAAARSRRSLEFLSGVIGSTDSMLAANPDQSVKAVLDRAAATVGESLKDDPTGAARVRGVVGAGYLSIGEPIYAETQLRLAAEGLAAAVGEDRINLHRALWHLWQARGVQDIHDDRLVRQIEALSADLLGEVDPSYGDMARAALAAHDRGEFEKAIDAVDALVERVKGAPATQARTVQPLAATIFFLPNVKVNAAGPEHAAYDERAFKLLLTLRSLPGGSVVPIPQTLGSLAKAQKTQGKLDEAEATLREVYAFTHRDLPASNTLRAAAAAGLGQFLYERGMTGEAAPLLEELATYVEGHPTIEPRPAVRGLGFLASMAHDSGDKERERSLRVRAVLAVINSRRPALDNGTLLTLLPSEAAELRSAWEDLLARLSGTGGSSPGDRVQAVSACALRIKRDVEVLDPADPLSAVMAWSLNLFSDTREADIREDVRRSLTEFALDRLEPWKERAPHLLINPLWEKWGWLSKDNDLAGAEAAARRCLALSERAWGAEYVWTQIARAQLGRSLVDQKRYAEALPALEQSARVQVNTWTAADANAAFTLQALFDACTGAGVGERADYFVIQAAWAGSFVPVKLVHAALERRAALTGAALDVDTLLDRAAAGEPGAAEQLRAKVAAYAAVRVRDVSSDGAAVLAAARIWLLRDRVVNTLRAPELLRLIEPLIRDAARIGMEPGGGPATKRAWVNTAVAESLLAIGDAPEAEGYARESLRIRELINGPNDLQAALAAALLARTLVEQGRFADALPLAERAWDRTRGRASSIRSFTWLWRARLGAGNAEGANALIGEVLSHQGTDQEARDPKAAADTLSDLACCIAKVGGLSDGSYALAHRCLVRSCELSPTYSSLAHLALAVARLPDRPGWASIADRFEEAAKARTAGETAYSRAEMALATALVRRRDGDTRGAWDALLEARRIMEHPRAQGYWLALLAAEVERLLE